MNYRGLSHDDHLARLERARTALHPYLAVIHVYGMIPWVERWQYYRRLLELFRCHCLTWPWAGYYLHKVGRGRRHICDGDQVELEAMAKEWLYHRKPEPQAYVPPTPRKIIREMRREAIVVHYGGQWPAVDREAQTNIG